MVKKRCSFSLLLMALCFGAFLLAALPVSAVISLGTDKAAYNYGDSIVASYELSRDQDFSGLVKLSLFCTAFDLEFYTLPTNLYAGEKQQVTVPPVSISPNMLGRCFVAANATSYDRSANESGTSNFFNVTNQLSVVVDIGKEYYLPRETAEISGRVGKSHSLPAGVIMTFLGADYASAVADNAFAYDIKLPRNVKAGKHSLAFLVNDSYGNSGSASAAFEVKAVPTRIVNDVGTQSLKPLENFKVAVFVYDQANDLIPGEVKVSVTDLSGAVVLSGSNMTGSNMTFAFPSMQKPGNYVLTSYALGLSAASQLVVEEVEQAAVSFDNRTVVLKNTGNVDYSRKFNISLSGSRKNYVFEHNVNLAPGGVFSVDITKAVSEDNYTVAFPTVSSAMPVENVFLEDNRDFLKKTSDAFGISRTGSVVSNASTGSGKTQAKLAPLLLFLILTVAAFFLVRNRGKRSGTSRGNSYFGSGGEDYDGTESPGSPAEKQGSRPVSPPLSEEDRVRLIMEEKRRQLASRIQETPKSLRDDPAAQKFVRDMMKEKKFR